MTDIIAELDTATSLLSAALDRYLDACSAFRTHWVQVTKLTKAPTNLSRRMIDETASVSMYDSKLKQARSIVGHVKNGLTPICVLPPEIVSRIFMLVMGSTRCVDADSSRSRYMPRYPDFLSHVCSRWRSIAIDLPALWTHIDLVYNHSSIRKYVDRAKVTSSRAADLALDVHIRAPSPPDPSYALWLLFKFLTSIAARTRSLELITPATSREFDNELFEQLFKIFASTKLLQFGITDYAEYTPGYIRGPNSGDDVDNNHQYLRVSSEIFEGLLLPVRTLKLDGLYPHWDSLAYHGLVDLRLEYPRGRFCSISATQLHNIFISSPRIAVLHLGLQITNSDWQDNAPAYLGELEVLDFGGLQGSGQLDLLLSLFTLGSKLLQVTLHFYDKPDFSNPDANVTKFLKNPNITRLCLRELDVPISLDDLFGLLPRLEVLALTGAYVAFMLPLFSADSQLKNPPLRLDALYIEEADFGLNNICLMAKVCSPRVVVLWQTQVGWEDMGMYFDEATLDEDYDEVGTYGVSDPQIRSTIMLNCPNIEHVHFPPESPTRAWSLP